MTAPGTDGRRSVGQLLKELADGGVALVRQEAALARVELADAAKGVGPVAPPVGDAGGPVLGPPPGGRRLVARPGGPSMSADGWRRF